MIGYFLVLGNRRGFCYGSSVQYGEEHVSIRPTFTAYLPDLSHFIIFIGRREQSSAEVERSSLSLSLYPSSWQVVYLRHRQSRSCFIPRCSLSAGGATLPPKNRLTSSGAVSALPFAGLFSAKLAAQRAQRS